MRTQFSTYGASSSIASETTLSMRQASCLHSRLTLPWRSHRLIESGGRLRMEGRVRMSQGHSNCNTGRIKEPVDVERVTAVRRIHLFYADSLSARACRRCRTRYRRPSTSPRKVTVTVTLVVEKSLSMTNALPTSVEFTSSTFIR